MVRTKTTGSKPPTIKKPLKGSGSSNPQPQEQENVEVDPYYTPELQASRFAKVQKRKFLSLRFVDNVWFTCEGFQFPMLLEKQGVNNFLALQGIIYPNLIREFYANLRYKDEVFTSMIKGKKFCMDRKLFREVGTLVCDGARVGDCENSVWKRFDANNVYLSCLRKPDQYVHGTVRKAGLMFVEDRIIHYLIVYILVQRSTNFAQPTVRDLQLLYAIKKGYMLDWPAEILRNMYLIVNSDKEQPLAYSIFISRIVDYLGIDTSGEVFEQVTKRDHLIDDGALHKMGIYKIRGEWTYEDDEEMEDAAIQDSGNEEDSEDADQGVQGPPDNASDIPAFGLAHLDAMEQRMYARMQGMEDRIYARMDAMERDFKEALRLQTEELKNEYTFASSILNDFNQPSQPDQPPNP